MVIREDRVKSWRAGSDTYLTQKKTCPKERKRYKRGRRGKDEDPQRS
jgi:hypothetical protein